MGAAPECQRRPGSSPNASVSASVSARPGRSEGYWEWPVGASMLSESSPPERNTDTRIASEGPAAIASPIPCSRARGASAAPPYTVRARPAERTRKERRLSPVPAGSGMPGSIAGRPLPASAVAPRSTWARV
jgi:hypothetical protein